MKRLTGSRLILGIALGFCALFALACAGARAYTSLWVNRALAGGVFPTAEAGMRALIENSYTDIRRIDILYSGPNSAGGKQPHVWYVIAEVRAASRADGSAMGKNSCDAPGSFFLQTHAGWFHVPEGAFPVLLGSWMSAFGLAGPGQNTPAIDRTSPSQARFCLTE